MATDINRREHLPCLLVVILGALLAATLTGCEQSPGDNSEPSRLPITISKETTYITEPLRPDGYPDYVAALNQRCSQGVTPENNAMIPMLNAFGLHPDFSKHVLEPDRQRYFQMLGIAPLPEKGDYYIDLRTFAETHPAWKRLLDLPPNDKNTPYEQESATIKRPWSKQKYPFIADWLATNEKPLSLFIEASKRPRSFEPMVPKYDMNSVYGCSLPEYFRPWEPYGGWLDYRECARAIKTQAMAQLYEGKTDEAWAGILASHRLARLSGQGPMPWITLLSDTLSDTASRSSLVFLEKSQLTADQLADMRKDIEKLPPMPKRGDKYDIGDRFACLDWILECQREGLTSLKRSVARMERVRSQEPEWAAAKKAASDLISGNPEVDWDIVLRTINSCFDQLVDVYRKPTHSQRAKTWRRVCDDILARAGSPDDSKWSSKEARSQRLGLEFFCRESLQDSGPFADDRTAMTFDVMKLAFALAEYHARNGEYPERLADLTPNYVASVPKDIFNNDADLHYARQDDGYLLYSVGLDGRDEGGRSMEDYYTAFNSGETRDEERWDDIVVRMPAAKR